MITKDTFIVSETALQPTLATEHSAGFDLHSLFDYEIQIGETHVLETGVALNMPYGYYAMVCSRSGMAAKNHTFVLNAPGIIDADYEDTIKVILHNVGHRPFLCKKGDRIAQLVFVPVVQVANALKTSTERVGGLGSTGK